MVLIAELVRQPLTDETLCGMFEARKRVFVDLLKWDVPRWPRRRIRRRGRRSSTRCARSCSRTRRSEAGFSSTRTATST